MKGIDVSVHNGDIDFEAVKAAGYDYVIIRAGYGKLITQKDKRFELNYARAKAAGLKVGTYWYSYARDRDEALLEASVFAAAIAGKQFEMPVYFDIEESYQMRLADILIDTFCREMERRGYFSGYYISYSAENSYVSAPTKSRFTRWIADWRHTKRTDAVHWQSSDSGTVPGINGNVDTDECVTDYEPAIRAHGLNGFPATKTETKTEKKTETKTETKTKHTIKVLYDGVEIFSKECD